ncbi:hypothetical protein BT63DRAFT_410444 [Microthyrium microscopicum]|uniref:Fungal N-terminal domain-containing protein n=1 Tax=Microthyrium microscopicum TaxID=703497 RepID=A0A6A6UNZ3_9PEZI|nr:hypothetical protein BT63DRAFT_410444 [Microthyrium microscopicum]
MIDPGTIFSALGLVGKVTSAVYDFGRAVGEAGKEMSLLRKELELISLALRSLNDEVEKVGCNIPDDLSALIQGCVEACSKEVHRLDTQLKKHNTRRLRDKVRYVWSGQEKIIAIRLQLERHRSALQLALDAMKLSLLRRTNTRVEDVAQTSDQVLINTKELKAMSGRMFDEILELRKILETGQATQYQRTRPKRQPKPNQPPKDVDGLYGKSTQNQPLTRLLDYTSHLVSTASEITTMTPDFSHGLGNFGVLIPVDPTTSNQPTSWERPPSQIGHQPGLACYT